MTLTEFMDMVTTTFPKSEWRLQVHVETRRTPAHSETLWGREEKHAESRAGKGEYELTFQQDFFDENEQPKRFAAPSLKALWETLKTTYATLPAQTVEEVEGWLKVQE